MRKASLIFLLLLSLPLAAESFYVKDYQVRIGVEETKVLHVEEVIDLFFTSPSHGLVRDIQYRFGSAEAEVSGVKVSGLSSYSRHDGCLSLYLGDPDSLISGDKRFTLSYDYAMPDDGYRDYDELYYNIVTGSGWDTAMDRVSFSMTFPAPLDKDQVWVTCGPYGSVSTLPFNLSDDGRTVSGSYSRLPAGYSLTVRAEMEDGYFTKGIGWERWVVVTSVMVSAITLLACIVIYLKGRDEPLVCPVRFSAPEGLSPMDVSYLLKGTVDVDAVSAMLVYWAAKGFLVIEEDGDDYSFPRVRFPADAPPGEAELFSCFFGDGDKADASSLRARDFHSLLADRVRKGEERRFSGDMAIYTGQSLRLRAKGRKILLASFAAFSVLMVLALRSPIALFMIVPAFMAYSVLTREVPLPLAVFLAGFLLVFMGASSTASPVNVMPAAISFLVSVAVGGQLVLRARKLSPCGRKLREETEGFREFIGKVGKDRIEVLSENDPELFYDVLPYAMVLGLAERWCDKFKDLYVRPAAWYRSRGPWDIYMYPRFARGFRDSYRTRVAPERSQGGRGTHQGYSGHAGGGFSGGGGHSW